MGAVNNDDPWLRNSTNTQINFKCEDLSFEDNFQETKYQRLDDSEQYLAILENKLLKLKTRNKSKEKEDLVQSAEDARNSYMTRLLTNCSRETLNLNQDLQLDTPVNINTLHSRLKYQLNPQQPLTVGEIAELLKYDALCENSQC